MFRRLWVLAACAAIGPVTSAFAQTTIPARAVAGADGFAIESDGGNFRLQVGALAQVDGRFIPDNDGRPIIDTFALRRLRPYLRGRLSGRFEFFLNPDFAGGTFVVQDAYLDTILSPALRIRIGKGKTPFGMERLHSSRNLLFVDRALPTALAPNRDVGIQILGDISGGVLSYLAGLMNGVPDGGSADVDANDGKDVSARLIVRPFAHHTSSRLRGLGVAVSGSAGSQEGAAALPVLRTGSAQQNFFSYATGTVADGTRVRYSPQVFYFGGPVGAWAEYTHTRLPVTGGAVTEDVEHEAWQVAASWIVTGETASDGGSVVHPRAAFDPSAGHWGAFQVAFRVHQLTVDPLAVGLALAATGSSRKATAWTAGMNWYLTLHLRYIFNFERTMFDDDPERPRTAENAFVFRTQVAF